MTKIHGENRRRYLRYRPDQVFVEDLNKRAQECTGFIDLTMHQDRFDPKFVGLVTDKSHSGCSLAIVADHTAAEELTAGRQCFVKAGPLAPMSATIRWCRDCGEGLLKVGFQFDE